jgi:hypothetical protein
MERHAASPRDCAVIYGNPSGARQREATADQKPLRQQAAQWSPGVAPRVSALFG